MQVYTEPINRLIEEFSKLPGVGRKTADVVLSNAFNQDKYE